MKSALSTINARFLGVPRIILPAKPHEGDEGGEGGDVDGGEKTTFTKAEVEAMTKGLKSKNQELLGKLAGFKGKTLPDGVSADDVRSALEFKQQKEKEELEAKGQYEALTKQMGEKHASEKRQLEEKLTATVQRVQNKEKRIAATDAIRELEGEVDLILPHVLGQLGVEEDGDDYVVFAIDKKGNAIVDSNGNKLTAKALVESMKKDPKFAAAFKAPNVGGSGARGGSGQTAGKDVVLTNAEAKDVSTYRRAREQAAKNGGQVVIRG